MEISRDEFINSDIEISLIYGILIYHIIETKPIDTYLSYAHVIFMYRHIFWYIMFDMGIVFGSVTTKYNVYHHLYP